MTDTDKSGYAGQRNSPSDSSSPFNAMSFLVEQMLGRIATAKMVKVMAVSNKGGITPVGTVDVQPLVKLMDGAGNTSDHGTLHDLPYFRVQGGAQAFILDPKVGDIGIAVFADRDSSSAKATKGFANPGSSRRHSMADGFFIGGFSNGTEVTSYVAFTPDGIVMSPDSGQTKLVVSPGKIEMVADVIVQHARNKNAFDAGGTGFVYAPGKIDNYTTGATTVQHAISPPQVPT